MSSRRIGSGERRSAVMPWRKWTTFFAAVVLVVATAVVASAQRPTIDELRSRAEAGQLGP